MFCRKCGEEISDEAVICPKCGCEVEGKTVKQEPDEEKTGVGILLGLFLGIIGLIIGLCLYKEGTIARKSFLKAWGITFSIAMAISLIGIIISVSTAVSAINSLY